MKLDERAMANMEVALDDVFRGQPHGGDHASRKHVARKLMQSARKGITTLGRLTSVAKSALQEIAARKAGQVEQTAPARRPNSRANSDTAQNSKNQNQET
jgi:hypothetical protein